MQESSGNPNARSTDGFNSFGLLQPSLNYHFYRYAPYLEQKGVLNQITNKDASQITPQDNMELLAKYQDIPNDWKSKQDINSILESPDVSLEVGLTYLKEIEAQVKSKHPDLTDLETMTVSIAAYNGGPNKISAMYNFLKTGETSDPPGFENARQHTLKVMTYYAQLQK